MVVIRVIEESLRARIIREPNLTLEIALTLGQSTEEAEIHSKVLKQKTKNYRIKSNKKENSYSQLPQKDNKTV